ASHPFTLPSALESQLHDSSIAKAAAEAWQDAIILFAAFGIKLRNVLDLTRACPPSQEEQQRGRKKLSLFAIFDMFFPDANLSKDKTIDHQKWFTSNLDAKQMKYGALDAFVSYAAGVRVLQRPGNVPRPKPYDLTLPSVSELLLAAQWVLTSQLQDANRPNRTRHDFYDAKFVSQKKQGLVLLVTMSRFKTRLRKGCWVELRLLRDDGRRISGICIDQNGKQATVGKMRWITSGSRSGSEKSATVRLEEVFDKVKDIEMQELKDTVETAACQELLMEVLCGQKRLLDVPLAASVFGGKSFLRRQQQSATTATST
ncbi:hypothetical protein Vretimale_18172, partial [Volvox reticuliferus]